MSPQSGDARLTADAVARRSYGKLVAYLSAQLRDVAAAEDALADAFAAALADWPKKGCPDNPEAWLLTVARRKSVSSVRIIVLRWSSPVHTRRSTRRCTHP